ncbi:MAG: 3-methyl-2-oxobutanoate hydroxymethyltransferase, partial [bacterium]
IKSDAQAVVDAGVFAMVLEKIPTQLAREITQMVPIPTIGIASGPYCNGQILVSYDMLGLADQFKFKFVRRYLEGAQMVREAVQRYIEDIKRGDFPSAEESF